MHSEVSTIQASSQKRLKGRPRTIGSTRSQTDTEKHIAKNGISPIKRAPNEGLFTCLPQKMRSSILLRHQINCGPRHSESSICEPPVCRLRNVVYRELWLMVHRRQRLDVLFIGWVLGRHADHERGNVQFDARATASSTDNRAVRTNILH